MNTNPGKQESKLYIAEVNARMSAQFICSKLESEQIASGGKFRYHDYFPAVYREELTNQKKELGIELIVRTYRNKSFIKRNYECTNIVFCKTAGAPPDNYVLCDAEDIVQKNCTQLYIIEDTTYFGYL